MFKEFFLREIKGAIRQPMVYIFFALFALMSGFAVGSDSVVIGGAIGNIYKNAPHVITMYTLILTLIGLLVATAYFNNAALRDYNNQFHEILFSTPIQKRDYFFGRFLGAMLVATIPLLGIFFGIIVGSILGPLLGDLSPDRIGGFNLMAYINNYLIFILPNIFISGTILFSLANKFRSTVVSFVGALGIIILYIISGTLASDMENETISALTDIFGIRTYRVVSQYYTPIEKNTLSPSFTGLILYNRLIWMAVGAIILSLSYKFFSFKERQKKTKSTSKSVAYSDSSKIKLALPKVHNYFNFSTEIAQFKSFFFVNFMSILKSITFKILFLFCLILFISDLVGGFEYFGLQSYPVTYKMIDSITEFANLFIFIIIVFFSGELIWRDRLNKINEVIDATPHSSIVSLLAKTISLLVLVSSLYFFLAILAVGFQLINGFTDIQLDLYITYFIIDFIPMFIAWSGILIFLQVIINNRYVGYFASILLFFIQGFLWNILDIRTKMVQIGDYPSLYYSDMNGFGPGLKGALWFQSYWALISFIVILIAGLLINRGVTTSLLTKFKGMKQQLSPKYTMALSIVGIAWLGVAGYIFYNTQVLNTYKTSDQNENEQVEYEKKYKKYQHIAQPKLTSAVYHIDIYPKDRDVKIKADLSLKNLSGKRIDSLHFTINESWNHKINIANAEQVYNDEGLGYQIFKLRTPLMPNDSIMLSVDAAYLSKGFENGAGNTSIAQNGTFFNNFSILPSFGYNEGVEIQDKHKRKSLGLPKRLRIPKLEEECSDHCHVNYLSDGLSDWVMVETYISTSSDQVAIAPGSLLKKWEESGRNHYHYKVDHPSQNFYSFISADYEVASKKWNDIDIEIYYDKKHGYNIDHFINAVEKSLEYYSENFGPYYHKQARIIEFPRYSTFAQAFPGTMPYSESFGFIIDLENEDKNNVIDAVIAHEMAHQWWAHQEVAAKMQGGTMLTESFAEYSSLMVMKSLSDKVKMKEFLKYDHNRYLRGRSSERESEQPLYKVENQQYIHYGKGSVILYALQDYIGEDKVNRALKNFLAEFRYAQPPYPTSLDFLEHLEKEVPDSLNYLIQDWFKEITLYDHRLMDASYTALDNGKYQVTMKVEAHKIKADTIGNEERFKPNDWVDIGVFADADEKELIYEKRVKFDKEELTFQFEVDEKPAKAAVDPRRILIERVYKDNIKSVNEE